MYIYIYIWVSVFIGSVQESDLFVCMYIYHLYISVSIFGSVRVSVYPYVYVIYMVSIFAQSEQMSFYRVCGYYIGGTVVIVSGFRIRTVSFYRMYMRIG